VRENWQPVLPAIKIRRDPADASRKDNLFERLDLVSRLGFKLFASALPQLTNEFNSGCSVFDDVLRLQRDNGQMC
jgi:hypothetical protein